MYVSRRTRLAALAKLGLIAVCAVIVTPDFPCAAEGIIRSPGVLKKISAESERLELTVNSSRILTLETRIPRVQVSNPDLLAVTPLSATQIQVSAKKAGVTQINLWDEEGNIYGVDVLIYGDARELEHALMIQFPNSNIRVFRYSNSLVLKGMVDRPDHVSSIMRLAEDYSPKVINNMNVAGVHQIMLDVKVMEVSRTKLRRLGFDFSQISASGGYVASAISGLLATVTTNTSGGLTVGTSGGETFSFGIVSGSDAFFGFLDALQQNDLMKILAEPVLTTVSGRPASFNVGGEFPVLVPQSLGTVSIEYKKFGTQVDFLPIVLGNGNIRLEVRPRVSEIDNTRSVVIQDITVPGLRVREIDTAVEMKAGQTLALAGLIQERTEAQFRGLPIVSNVPIFGMPFRRVEEEVNEIELLILVTPEYVDAMAPNEVPGCGPGSGTKSPSDFDLYFGGFLEVPKCGPQCGPQPGQMMGPAHGTVIDPAPGQLPGGPTPAQETLPPGIEYPAPTAPDGVGGGDAPTGGFGSASTPPVDTGPRPYSPNRTPTYVRSGATTAGPDGPSASDDGTGLIGPIGYDVEP